MYYAELFRKELFDNCLPFWLNNGLDREYGGLLNCLDRTGKVYSTDKSVWMQGRAGWTFSYLYNNIRRDETYLEFAKSCIDFAASKCIDPNDGRMYFTVTRDGRPLRKRRYYFSETFYIIANAEYYKATNTRACLEEAEKYFDLVYDIYRDPACDPYKITPKYYAETRRTKSLAEPMILLNVTSVLRDANPERKAYYDEVTDKLITDIKRFYKPEYHAMFETLSIDDQVISESATCRVINPGHDMECSWFLLEEAKRRGDAELVDLARTIFDNAFELGWDERYGGIYYFKDVMGLPVEAYEHDMKLWWVHNEAMIASLTLYEVTALPRYLDIFKRVTEYSFSHFADPEYGEWYGYLRRDGLPTEPPCKGHTYKGPFHVPRMLAKCMTIAEKLGV